MAEYNPKEEEWANEEKNAPKQSKLQKQVGVEVEYLPEGGEPRVATWQMLEELGVEVTMVGPGKARDAAVTAMLRNVATPETTKPETEDQPNEPKARDVGREVLADALTDLETSLDSIRTTTAHPLRQVIASEGAPFIVLACIPHHSAFAEVTRKSLLKVTLYSHQHLFLPEGCAVALCKSPAEVKDTIKPAKAVLFEQIDLPKCNVDLQGVEA